MKETFEDYLKKVHAEDYMGIDDDMPDSFESYLEDLDTEVMIKLADEWTKNVLEFALIRIKQIKGVYSAHDALEKVEEILSKLK
jgi:hypothetical protein